MITKNTNNSIINFLKKYGWCAWTGFILGSLGMDALTLKFWIAYIPLIILVDISKKVYLNEFANKLKEDESRDKQQKDPNLDFFR